MKLSHTFIKIMRNIMADKKKTIICFLLISLLTGCGSPTETVITNSPEPQATIMLSPTAVLPIKGTKLPPPENIVKFQPFEITSAESLVVKPMGALSLCGDSTIQLLRFVPAMKLETIVETTSEPLCDGTSPDGKWIAYEQDSKESPTGSWLIVQSADGKQQKRIPMNPDWRSFGDYVWLDNQHLLFNDFINLPDVQRLQDSPAYPMVVFNPFTEEKIELSSDYPNLQLSVAGPASRMDFAYSDVVYDPSLDLVIFPSWGGEHNYIVLWDIQSKTVLAKVEDQSGGFGHYPLWSPDATQFAVPVVNAMQGQHAIEEWYSVSREGQVEQLTHFGDYFSDSDIGSASNWSPDGQKLAFWVNLSPSPCPGLRLAVLDMRTKQVTNTCLPGTPDYAPPPIWSLDSRYIVVRDASAPQIKTILVDFENDRTFDITTLVGDSPPIGWLVSP